VKPRLRKALLRLTAGVCLCGVSVFILASGRPPREGWTPREVKLPGKVSGQEAAEILEGRGVLASPFAFRVLMAFPGVSLHSGTYLFVSPPTTLSVARRVSDGDVVRFAFVVPPGTTVQGIARALSALGIVSAREFESKAGASVRRVFPDSPAPEGYLAPGEYLLAKGANAEDIALAMAVRMRKAIPGKVEIAARKAGLTLHQVVTAASIIEKETRSPGERRLVSGVIHRRIRAGMPLQMDPTGMYEPPKTRGSAKKHLYDTYRNKGLPPGPIASPGPEAIAAVVTPLDRGFLFFVSNGDGTHRFSRTYAEHCKAVAAYRQRLSAREAREILLLARAETTDPE